ncbi:MAG: Mrp/NBP35 family ATP-binding protein [Chitinophagales bacterium]
MVSEEQILKALSTVIDPDFKKDLVSLGMIKNVLIDGSNVNFTIELTTPACPLKDQLEGDSRAAIAKISKDLKVSVEFTSRVTTPRDIKSDVLTGVKNVIAVASGKGGVGKSTVAVSLALGLAKKGAKVGLLDADIYGPSIPTMLGVKDRKPGVQQVGEKHKILPVEVDGLKVVSIGFLVNELQAVVWRGPMVSSALRQFISDVIWGELDYLVLDLPPGTGDVHLTLAQMAQITGAIIVTTPQEVASADARKAISMFQLDNVNVPVLGVIENMAYFTPDELPDKKYYLFGQDGGKRLAEQFNVPFLGELPLIPAIGRKADLGVMGTIDSKEVSDLVENVARHIAIVNANVKEESTSTVTP